MSNEHRDPLAPDPMRRMLIRVRGMAGPRCVASVTSALSFINGVSDVDVSLNEGRARLSLDARKAEVEQLRTAIGAVGFDALIFEDFPGEEIAGGQAAA